VTLADTTSGSTIYYTTNGTTPSTTSTKYTAAIPVSMTTTIEAIAAASGYNNSAVASGTYTITPQGSGTVSVSLSGVANVDAIATVGTNPVNGGLDTSSYSFNGALLGSALTWSGATFNFGATGVADAVANTTIPLPAGSYTALEFLATGVNGNQASQSFVVTYSDGSTATYTQGVSDWFTPQGYTGETSVLTMATRVTPTGTAGTGPCYLYGYSFALNAAKTAVSITLPKTRNVVVLAIELLSSGTPTAATPTFNPAAGTYTTAQSVTLADTTSGSTIYYTTNGTTPSTTSTKYTAAIPVSMTTTIEAIAAASGYNNSAVASATYTISSQGSTPVSVSLASAANVYGIATVGTAPINGGLDSESYSFNSALLGSSLTWSGAAFSFGGSGSADAVSNATIALPAGSYVSLNFLATGVNGNQPNESFVVTYSDGSTSTFTQGISDWFTPQNYQYETTVLTMATRVTPSGASGTGPCYLYGYSFALNSAKTPVSITLPKTRNVVVLAMDLVP
jgi:hypothetical protein